MAILVLLIKRDVPQFVTVFMVIIFSLGGALYLSLVGYYNDGNVDTENNNETRYHICILLVILVEYHHFLATFPCCKHTTGDFWLLFLVVNTLLVISGYFSLL